MDSSASVIFLSMTFKVSFSYSTDMSLESRVSSRPDTYVQLEAIAFSLAINESRSFSKAAQSDLNAENASDKDIPAYTGGTFFRPDIASQSPMNRPDNISCLARREMAFPSYSSQNRS